jgi:hypothetical protein
MIRVDGEVFSPQGHADHMREVLDGGVADSPLGHRADHEQRSDEDQREGDEPSIETG